MNDSPRPCSNCGAPLDERSRNFCEHCGAALAAAPSAPPPLPVPPGSHASGPPPLPGVPSPAARPFAPSPTPRPPEPPSAARPPQPPPASKPRVVHVPEVEPPPAPRVDAPETGQFSDSPGAALKALLVSSAVFLIPCCGIGIALLVLVYWWSSARSTPR
ncbi:MAG: zinc-ribbon domain-containing protein [Planctomycetes bacterium]|nr:zinc-ribbon domain-containing protein [Planctomycetota bacterium]